MKPIFSLFASFALIISYQLSSNCNAQNNSIVLDGAYIVMDGGTATNNIYIVVDQPNPAGIIRLPTGGHIHSENQYNYIKWLSGSTTGNYIFPFGVAGNASDHIPFSFDKTAGNSSISMSTWATDSQNMPHPEATNVGAVSNMLGITDSVEFAIDRFWDIQATSATADLTFSYRGIENTTSTPTSFIQAQHWNGNSWDAPVGPGTTGVTAGIGTAGPFIGQNTFSPWVLIAPCPVDSVSQNHVICQGESITVGTNTYTTTGIFIDNLTNVLGCDSIVTTNLTVNPIPTGTDTQIACNSFTWIDGVTYTTNNNTATHTLIGGAANGCDSIVTLDLTIETSPAVDATSNAPICEGKTLNLMATPINGATYQWTGPNGFTSQIQNPTITSASGVNSGTYTVVSSVGNNCESTDQITIMVNPLPSIIASVVNDNCGFNAGQINIDASSPNTPLSYFWSNGSSDAIITGLSEGTYEVTVTDATSCSITESFQISNILGDCDCFVYVANAFSPNGDGNNDFIPVRGECVSSLTFKIFNRWGNLVFETNKLDDGWDGYYKGVLQNTGIYIYTLDATFGNGKFVQESGDISLIR